ncbi:MAG TPA: hypothetical protein VHA33_08715 [Candidatus Angelobacter sp.]|jgi:hypothetical protein|nr:hypothetical protein [Candidatus Angelobacter sp.]
MPKRSTPSLAAVLLICLFLALVLFRYFHRTNPQINCGEHCGTERWLIKTLVDSESRRIDWNPRSSSISDLVSLEAPRVLDDSRAQAETRVYSVEAILIGWKVESGTHGDRDYHLVLADPSELQRTLIAEVPSSDCAGACSSSHVQQFLETRWELENRLSAPQAHFRRLKPAWLVQVQGVGFFDIYHNQIGVAENCIELHPVLHIEFVRELGPETVLPQRIEPPAEHRCGRLQNF